MLYDIQALPPFEITKGFVAKMIHTDRVTLAYVDVEAGAELPEHSHPQEQVTTLLEGRFEFVLDGQTTLLEPGVAVVIPSNAKHSGRAITVCRILDVFQPVREDFRSGVVAYARR